MSARPPLHVLNAQSPPSSATGVVKCGSCYLCRLTPGPWSAIDCGGSDYRNGAEGMTELSQAFSIRPYREEDWTSLWPVIRDIAATGQTFVYDRDISETHARDVWLGQRGNAVFVAEAKGGEVVGTAKAGPNQAGPGSHVATASFMVRASYRGQGIGHALACHVIDWATVNRFLAMQFNAVVEHTFPKWHAV